MEEKAFKPFWLICIKPKAVVEYKVLAGIFLRISLSVIRFGEAYGAVLRKGRIKIVVDGTEEALQNALDVCTPFVDTDQYQVNTYLVKDKGALTPLLTEINTG